MTATKLCLRFCISFLILVNIECAVIRMNEIPINEDFVMKIVVKQDPITKEALATIKIGMEEEKSHQSELLPSLMRKLVRSENTFVPDLSNRNSIVSGNCALGQVRRGPKCVTP